MTITWSQLPRAINTVFTHPDPAGAAIIAAKTTFIYLFLILGLRLLGKRELGQMTLYDLILIIVLANSVQNAMIGSGQFRAGKPAIKVHLLGESDEHLEGMINPLLDSGYPARAPNDVGI